MLDRVIEFTNLAERCLLKKKINGDERLRTEGLNEDG